VTPPALEIADLIRTAGPAFVERNRQWIRWKHVKVLLAVARCRVRPHSAGISMNAPAAHIALPSRITAAVTATAPSSIKEAKSREKTSPCRTINSCVVSCCTCFPQASVRIRHFGFLACRRRATTLHQTPRGPEGVFIEKCVRINVLKGFAVTWLAVTTRAVSRLD